MKNFSKIFLRGVFTLMPFGLTVLILFSFLSWTEQVSKQFLSLIAGELYFPGLGLIIGFILIYLLGLMTSLPFMEGVIKVFELPFKNVPLIKSVYSAVKSLSDYMSPQGEHSDQQVVMIKFPGLEVEMIGFVTLKTLKNMPAEFSKDDRVAVFLPLSYMVGGLTVFVPRAYIKTTNLRVETAMRSSLTAWMPDKSHKERTP